MKNILIGNGINIEFSKNNDYKNYKIIERLSRYLCSNRYDKVFQGSITSEELQNVIVALNEFFQSLLRGVEALKLASNEDELKTLIEIAARYNGKPQDVLDVGIEDNFFVMKLLFNKVGDEATPINALYDGLKWLYLDAIYNDGKIEELHREMGSYAKELKQYNKVFTVNYDTNLDKLTAQNVYHLHGSFDTFDDTYREDTLIGYLAKQKPNSPEIVVEMEHLYCNAIMSFSGEEKMKNISVYSNGNKGLDEIMRRLSNPLDLEAREWYEKLKKAKSNDEVYTLQSINARLENPLLRCSEYPFDEFTAIRGELHIVGMSPNNDSHIIGAINDNANITNVVFFYAGKEDRLSAQKKIKKPLKTYDIFKYWKSLE